MAVTLRGAKNQLIQAVASDTPAALFFVGLPGVGKTSAVGQAARQLGIGFKPVISHLYMPSDVLGLPFVWEERTRYAPPEVFPRVDRDGERGLFFLDELPNCVGAMQSAWAIVILERSVRKYKFPPGWKIVCAGNPPGTSSGSNRLIGPLQSRVTAVPIEPDPQEFFEYGVSQAHDEDGVPLPRRRVVREVTDFLFYEPTALLKYDPQAAFEEFGFPSPRTWERASDVMRMPFTHRKHEREVALVGAIGQKMTTEFMKYLGVLQSADAPSDADILANRVNYATLDNKGAAGGMLIAAAAGTLLDYVIEHPDPKRVATVLEIAKKMPAKWRGKLLWRLWLYGGDPTLEVPGVVSSMMPQPPAEQGMGSL